MRSMIPGLWRMTGLALGLAVIAPLSGCGGMADNRLLDSVHQPVVAHRRFQLDLVSGPDGLAPDEQGRLDGWFAMLEPRYGDRIALDDPLDDPRTRAGVSRAAARYGLPIDASAMAAEHTVGAGTVRIVVSRSIAGVPHCPDLTTRSESNFNNATSSNYGCAVNGNLAAMVANPDDLLNGVHGPTLSSADTADQAIWLHQAAVPTGQAGVTRNSTN